MSSAAYMKALRQVLENNHLDNNCMPAPLLRQWADHIDSCEGGYSMDFSEYCNDMYAREPIQILLDSELLKPFSEINEFRQLVDVLDARFRQLLQTNVRISYGDKWWHNGVLKRAGEEYRNDLWTLYGVEVSR
jgi:hypothetical protein